MSLAMCCVARFFMFLGVGGENYDIPGAVKIGYQKIVNAGFHREFMFLALAHT